MVSLTCKHCGLAFQRRQRQRFCSLSCRSLENGKTMRGTNHPTFKGRLTSPDGYIRVWAPGHPLAHKDGYVQEHRLILYEAGIEVPADAHVHHINRDRSDNRPENLQVLKSRQHIAVHLTETSVIRNQYGTWPLLTADQKRERQREHMRAWREKRRAAGLPTR